MELPLSFLAGAAVLAATPTVGAAVNAEVPGPRVLQPGSFLRHTGMADASAAAFLEGALFVVGNDEDNVLRVYSAERGGAPLQEFDLTRYPGFSRQSESDLEGAARVGNLIYWITSHGANKEGKRRPDRHRLFATVAKVADGTVTLSLVGRPYTRLVEELAAAPGFEEFHLAAAARMQPKERGALNIEGLAATPAGGLLIGFRNPIPGGKALAVELLNPAEVTEGAARARFGMPVRWDLGGLGIRDLLWADGVWLILAGSHKGGGPSRLYRCGAGGLPALIGTLALNDENPEGLLRCPPDHPASRELLLLSDDGTRIVDGVQAKKLKNRSRQSFRSFRVRLPD